MRTIMLLESTPNAEKVVATAARQCYSEAFVGYEWDDQLKQNDIDIIRKVLSYGHTSILEHASYTFAIDGISRSCSHQLVRFRHATFSQQSQRYVDLSNGANYVLPESIASNKDLFEAYQYSLANLNILYRKMIRNGIPPEDARYILPNATQTKVVMTMNARELHHAFNLRCCQRAQWEIRYMFEEILDLVKNRNPVLFEKAGASCVATGKCPEGEKGCGRIA